MPETEVFFFAEEDGSSPILEWLDHLPSKAQDKCTVRIERLAEPDRELRRPEADYLRDGIYELRATYRNIRYRILYFFVSGQAIVSHGCVKGSEVPPREIDPAVDRKNRFAKNPLKHPWREKE